MKDLLNKVRGVIGMDRQAEAMERVFSHLALNPEDPLALRWLGRFCLAHGLPDDAASLLERSLYYGKIEHPDGLNRGERAVHGGQAPEAPPRVNVPEGDDADWDLVRVNDTEARKRRMVYAPHDELGGADSANLGIDKRLDGLPATVRSDSPSHIAQSPRIGCLALESPHNTVDSSLPFSAAAHPDAHPLRPPEASLEQEPNIDCDRAAKADALAVTDGDEYTEDVPSEDALDLETLFPLDPKQAVVLDIEGDDDADASTLPIGAVDRTPDFDLSVWGEPPEPIEPLPPPPPPPPKPLMRWERARQVAIALADEFNWDKTGATLLTEVFDRYGWGAARAAMFRELNAGMTPEELGLAFELREIWAGHAEFATDLTWVGAGAKNESAHDNYRSLSWPMALKLVRLYDAYPDAASIEHWLEELFDDWYGRLGTSGAAPAFSKYLYFRLGVTRSQFGGWPDWQFEADDMAEMETDDCHQPGGWTREHQTLSDLGLLPQVQRACPTSSLACPSAVAGNAPSVARRQRPKIGSAGDPPPTRVCISGNRIILGVSARAHQDKPTPDGPGSAGGKNNCTTDLPEWSDECSEL